MELDIVQRVELKLLLADSDEKLSGALATFLAPLLQKLNSSNVEVVRKVQEILNFVEGRKSQSKNVKVPVNKLMQLFQKDLLDMSPGIVRQNRHLLTFVGLGLVDEDEKVELDDFVLGLRNDKSSEESIRDLAAEQFSLFLLQLNRVVDASNVKISKWDPADLATVQRRLPDLFILNLRVREFSQPALSLEDISFFLKHGSKLDIVMNPRNDSGINATRKSALKLARAFPDKFKYTLVAAMGDPMLELSREARSEVLKLRGYDAELLHKWAMYGNDNLSMEVIELMIRHRLFNKLDPGLITTAFKRGDLRLRHASLRLLKGAVLSDIGVNSDLLNAWGPDAATNFGRVLHQYIIDDGWPRSQTHSATQTHLRQLCYELLGIFSSSKSTLAFLFQSLERDSPDFAPHIQKSLSLILESGGAEIDADKLLGLMQHSKNNRTRYAVVRFAGSRLNSQLPIQKVICLLGIDPSKNRSDVILEAQRGLSSDSAEDLPPFNEMLKSVTEIMDLDIASVEVVNTTLLFLLACLVRWSTASSDWVSDLNAAVSLSKSPLEQLLKQHVGEVLPLLRLLLSFVYSEHYHEIVPSLLRKIFLVLSEDDRKLLAASDLVNESKLLAALRVESNGYGIFLAEYIPQFAPQVQVNEATTSLEIAAQAFRAVELNEPSDQVNDLVVSKENLDAIQVLAAAGHLKLSDNVSQAAASSQFAMACIAINAEEDRRAEFFTKLLDHTPKAFDDIVANGEAISVVSSGWQSKVLQDRYPYLSVPRDSNGNRSRALEERVLELIADGIRGSPESRRIACVRLLCLTQYSFYDIKEFHGVARGIQSCFMSLLSDSDDVTQESAGRGLSILFENSTADVKLQNSLLSGLLSSFTDDNKAKKHNAGLLTAETQVFEPGALPSEPRGDGSISTYKDVLSLANETGDSSLIYKFMSLSASSQIWNGRKGMAFSLEQIIAKSELAAQTANGSELGQKLIPKLFRYLHDPMEVTKEAMKHIWTSLVPSARRSQVIRRYLPGISKELLEGIVNREWRVRQASAGALADLVSQGYLQDDYQLWSAGFRAVDDIKESVSSAGSELLKSLTQSLIRSNSMGRSSDLSEIVPFLIKGLATESTQKFSLETLLKLSETDGFKPWAVMVLEELILQLSSLEPQALNYLALNTSQELVDEARSKGLRSSPIMQGIEAMVERGVPSTDEMWEVLPRIVKKSVGVSSQLAASRLVILTCMHSYGESKNAPEQLLNAAFSQLWSNNVLVSQNYASALGYLCRQLPLPLVISFVEKLKHRFVSSEADESQIRSTIALALKNLSTNSSDVFSSVSTTALPLAFVGKYAVIESEAKPFKDIWENNTGGTLSLRFYATEIVQFGMLLLKESSVRTLKVAACEALAEVLSRLDLNNAQDVKRSSTELTIILLSNMVGRSWPGKEHVFTALVYTYRLISGVEDELNLKVEERVLNEVQRKNVEYKLAIVPSVAKFIEYMGERNKHPELQVQIEEQLVEHLISVIENDKEDVVSAFSSTFVSLTSKELEVRLLEHALSQNSWKFRTAACEAIARKPFNDQSWHLVTASSAGDEHHERVRLSWSQAAAKFKDEPQVLDDVRSRIPLEMSSLVLAELKNIIRP